MRLTSTFFLILTLLCGITGWVNAQDSDEVISNYTRPNYKVFRSVSAALQQPDSVFILELKGKKLTEIPEGVYKLPNLLVLDLGRNKIKVLPESISRLQSLEELDLSNNKLTKLPAAIGKLKNLKKLSLNRNVIEELPISIGELSSLEYLELWDNELGTLPDEIKDLENLKVLELRGILFSEDQQQHFQELLPKARIYMSPSCNCKL